MLKPPSVIAINVKCDFVIYFASLFPASIMTGRTVIYEVKEFEPHNEGLRHHGKLTTGICTLKPTFHS